MLDNIKLGVKLISGFVLVAILATVIGVAGMIGLKQALGKQDVITGNSLPSIANINTVNFNIMAIKAGMRTLSNPDMSNEDIEAAIAIIQKRREAYKKADSVYDQLSKSPEEAAVYKEFKTRLGELKELNNKIIDLVHAAGKLPKDAPQRAEIYKEVYRIDRKSVV